MKRKQKILRKLALLLCMAMLFAITPADASHAVYAKTVSTFSSTTKALVCGTQAKIKLPSGYKRSQFTSSNKKVATVTSKGVVKAVRLGVAKITAKSGNRKKTYTITVKPKKASEVWLNQEALLTNQKLQFKLESDQYDTSQVNLRFESGFSEISSTGKCKGVRYSGWGSLRYAYGSFSKSVKLAVYTPDEIVDDITGDGWGYDSSGSVFAGTPCKIGVGSQIQSGKKLTPSQLKKLGITLLLDGKTMPDTVVFTPGQHVISMVSGSKTYQKNVAITYSVKDALTKKDATGYSTEGKEVFDAAFSVVDQIITENMTDSEKVKAIHDYLIYHANYVNNGDYASAEKWAYGAEGVLLHGEGVCQSYAIAFYMMATAAGVECEYVTGVATSSPGSSDGHAWNRVKLDGVWYYIDCTWDDPVGGGYEGYDYYLSETLWGDHVVEECIDLAKEGKYDWENFYLTGKGYLLTISGRGGFLPDILCGVGPSSLRG